MHNNDSFLELKRISNLVEKLVETQKHVIYLLVLFACEVSFDLSYCNSIKKIFDNKIYKK